MGNKLALIDIKCPLNLQIVLEEYSKDLNVSVFPYGVDLGALKSGKLKDQDVNKFLSYIIMATVNYTLKNNDKFKRTMVTGKVFDETLKKRYENTVIKKKKKKVADYMG